MDKDPLDKLDRSGRLALLTRWLIDGCGAIAGILLVISVAATSYAIYEISQEGSVQPSEVKATPLSPSPQCFKSVTGQNVRPSGSEGGNEFVRCLAERATGRDEGLGGNSEPPKAAPDARARGDPAAFADGHPELYATHEELLEQGLPQGA
eukprot:gene2028-2719_t